MNTFPFYSASFAAPAPPPHPRSPMLPPNPLQSSAFWESKNVHDRFKELHDTLLLTRATQKELEVLMTVKDAKASLEHGHRVSIDSVTSGFSGYLEDKKIDLEAQELLSLDAANSWISKLRAQIEPFQSLVDNTSPWEEKSASFSLSEKLLKSKWNKLWRKRKRKCIAEILAKGSEQFEQADRKADERRTREIAKDANQLKMAKMKEIAKLKAKEKKKRLESEHFLPEEDDKFLERVRAAVEEEERQAVAGADTNAAKDAIATAEESRKTTQSRAPISKDLSADCDETKVNEGKVTESKVSMDSVAVTGPSAERTEGQSYIGAYDSLANLPMEFYHYYHGSNNDTGTLIEVRRTWDGYVRPGGSRIPGHWVQPPPPADDVWASYLVRPH